MEMTPQQIAAAMSAALAPMVAQIEELSSSVAALQEGRGILRDQAPEAQPTATLSQVTRAGLVKSADDTVREERRATASRLGFEHNVLMHYINFGGRGLYRDCHEFCSGLPFHAKQAIILDAQSEDVREAFQMSADLLKFTGDNVAPRT